ncbi:MAG: hypothetical protein WB496_18520 [Pseudolabrys sp.]
MLDKRGASGLTLQRAWQMMGALEAVDGMLLFGVSTAYLFSVMQVYWSMLTARDPQQRLTRDGSQGGCQPSAVFGIMLQQSSAASE